jgi:hypothetical protein
MRAAFVTILPMLAAAVLVMAGGERISRREVANRTVADRERLLDLAAPFREELMRLDDLYLGHLHRIAQRASRQNSEQTAAVAGEIVGVRLVRIFKTHGKDETISPALDYGVLPEIEIKDRKRPFNPSTAIVLEPEWLEKPLAADTHWIDAPRSLMRVRLLQLEPGTLMAILVDIPEVRKITAGYLTEWLAQPLVPLEEAGERVQVDSPDGVALTSIGPARHGPAASIIPIRNLTGDWQIRSWDVIVVSHSHDATTLILACTSCGGVGRVRNPALFPAKPRPQACRRARLLRQPRLPRARHAAHQSLAQPRPRNRSLVTPPGRCAPPSRHRRGGNRAAFPARRQRPHLFPPRTR